ncbi:ankyrin-3 isoform X2 [Vigna radiata var. radiata]|uniref:Ankyrin-3 isoform X2 n=1 Tax=Vigna radiata var. radiata TaxID=3916 RepID=A0A3Q0ETV1_VIGRR|nr:ankyrin-3 isoform X2 [Vigna radiata var. radiata]
MMVLANSGSGLRRQVFPVDYETELSQRLVEAAYYGDTESAFDFVDNPSVDVNFVGTVSFKFKTTEIVLQDESPHRVNSAYEEFKTELTALFLAAHTGNLTLLRKLLNVGANVNMRMFRGYATTASVREGHLKVLEVLINAGASQLACEEALMEASYLGRARFVELLMQSNMIRPQVAVHALVSACCRGFVEVVDVLIKVGVRLDMKVKLGAWSWDTDTGEEFRVGVGLAEAYPITWCAVEYFESTGAILHMLLCHLSPNILHIGRSLLHHAIICNNERAVNILLNNGADTEVTVQTTEETSERAIHIVARVGSCNILQCLINGGCNLDSQTKCGDTALMICTRHKHEKCLGVLASAGADLGMVNSSDQCATSIANFVQWTKVYQKVILDVIRAGKIVRSSNAARFSALLFVTRANDMEGMKKLIENGNINLNEQNANGFSAAMIAAVVGNVEAFKLLLYAGADVTRLKNKYGLTALNLVDVSQNSEAFHKVMLEYALKGGGDGSIEANPLHRAACYGDISIVHKLLKEGYEVNAFDGEGYTPLMLAARGCRGEMCELLISYGAECDIQNERHETALSLSRENGAGNDAERVILDELARKLVLGGHRVKKHTKCGKGSPHGKFLQMIGAAGILRWGKSSKRNVICKEAEVGPSVKFRWNRRRKFDVEEPGLFHVVTTKDKQVHFVCEGGIEMADLWVRGIQLVTREAISGRRAPEV